MSWYIAGSEKPLWVWLETLIISVGALALAYWLSPGNPLYVNSQFPWTWLAPIVVALRYGVGPGIAAVVVLLAGWGLFRAFDLLDSTEFPTLSFLGGFIVTLLCAEFSSYWFNRLRSLERRNVYGEDRLDELTRKYYLLHLSHEKLYQSLISRPVTLFDSLLRLRQLMVEEHEPGAEASQSFPGLQPMLSLLANTCQVTNAGVYRVIDEKVQPAPLASIGALVDLDAADPLVVHALEQDSAAHINLKELKDANPSRYLLAVPMRNFDKEWIAVLLVERMPFLAFTQENLQILLALVSYYADGLIASRTIAEVSAAFPDCPLDFIDVLARLTHVHEEAGIESSLVIITLPTTGKGLEVLAEIRRTQRTLDSEWIRSAGNRIHRLVLMPMADASGANGFIARTDLQLQERFGDGLEKLGVNIRRTRVATEPLATLQRALQAAS